MLIGIPIWILILSWGFPFSQWDIFVWISNLAPGFVREILSMFEKISSSPDLGWQFVNCHPIISPKKYFGLLKGFAFLKDFFGGYKNTIFLIGF